MTYEVPFNIIDAILNNLVHESDWETIRSLCQTCKNLVEPCQKQLFSTVAIHHMTIPQLNSLLAERPNLVAYVLHLHYYMDRDSVICGDVFRGHSYIGNSGAILRRSFTAAVSAIITCTYFSTISSSNYFVVIRAVHNA